MGKMILSCFLLLCCRCGNQPPPADTIFINGNIWTVDAALPRAAVIAVTSSKISFIGSQFPEELQDADTKTIDLQGKFVLPGFIDSHLHFMDGGNSLNRIDLRNMQSKDQFIQHIRAYAEKIPKGTWILGGNWDHTNWSPQVLPEKTWIDAFTREHPIFINRLDGHMALANSLALKLAGVDNSVQEPPGGVIVRDQAGKLSGIFKESAKLLVSKAIPYADLEERIRVAKGAIGHLLKNGVTSVHDMGTWQDVELYDILNRENQLKVRITTFPPIAEWKELQKYGKINKANLFLAVKGVKGYMDGSLGSSTAKFFKPYSNDASNSGVWDEQMIPPDTMYQRIKNTCEINYQTVIHAIGTEANQVLLNMYEDVLQQTENPQKRLRIEHAQHLLPEDILRFGRLGIIASMQPYHCIDDGRWAQQHIGYDRCKDTYAFRSLLDSGAKLAFGSDWDVAPVSPLAGIYAAVTRRTLDDKNPEGWIPEQKISLQEAIRCYTINGAYAEYAENIKGNLKKGKLADFVVLSQNIFAIEPTAIKNVEVLKTIVGGKIVYTQAEI